MADIRRTRFDALPPRNTTEYGTREGQSVEANEVSLVKNLNGKIVREGKFPVAVGTHGDVWQGRWKRCDREKGGKRTHDEKVGPSLTTSTQLTYLFVVNLESASSAEIISECAQSLTIPVSLPPIHVVSFRGYQVLDRELSRWAGLRHRNVLPFYGAYTSQTPSKNGSRGLWLHRCSHGH